jgi:serine/threonine protein kinase
VSELRRDLDVLLHPDLRGHRNISTLLYIGWEDLSLFPILAFRLADYGTLEDFLSSAGRGPVGVAERTLLTKDVALGLCALHKLGFAH